LRTPFRKSHGKITFVLYNRPYPCGGKCIYCFYVKGFTKSTTANDDTELAKNCNWNGKCQLAKRFLNYELKQGTGIKCDLSMKGDSFAAHEHDYLRRYVKEVYDFLNGISSNTLCEAKKLQKNGADRCVSFKVETRPDQINEEKYKLFMELGVTTVELGVQSLDDEVLEINKRGHDTGAVARATKLLRTYGFEVCYQVMVGLPGSNIEKDMEMLTEKLWENKYGPDALKIYPCLLLKKSIANQKKLFHMYEKKIWKPLDNHEYINLLFDCYPHFPKYVHVNRIQRIIPSEKIKAGTSKLIDRNIFSNESNCLWQRSIAQKLENLEGNFQNYSIINYNQGVNRFCFEAIICKDIVLGYGRLDILPDKVAIIRDVRVLGNMLIVGTHNENKIGCQHIRIGRSIENEMEKKALENEINKIIVKPAFGVFSWFEKLDFEYQDEYYMKKELKPSHNK